MNERTPHDFQRARERQRQHKALNANGQPRGTVPPRVKRTMRHKILAGFLLGSFAYLLVSCFESSDLHKSKIDRYQFRFDHHHGNR